MKKQKKSLLCMYVDNFCGIEKESFNFCIERRYMVTEGKISRKSGEEIKGLQKGFWGDNVSAVTLLIGENGAGKTTLMRLLIKWLCQLSVGHIPQEKGALVISVGGKDQDQDQLIAFDGGKFWTIVIDRNEKIVRIEDRDEIKKLLGDIRLAYYTDTMTDLELSSMLEPDELEFLWDDSLFTRLSNSMKGRYRYTAESIKDCIKQEEFVRQMNLFLYRKEKSTYKKKNPDKLPEFPIYYMKFTAIKAGDENGFQGIPDGNDRLIREAIDLWNKVFTNNVNYNLPAVARHLLWGLFTGTIISLLQWERTHPKLKDNIVAEQVENSLKAYNRSDYNDWNTFFKRFFKNLFHDCKREFHAIHCYEEFQTEWGEQVKGKINNFFDVLKNIGDGEFWGKWTPVENTQNIWEFKLECFNKKDENGTPILLEDWKDLWKHYLTVAHLMPECRFDWKYASSGGKNKSNLYTNLFNIVKKCSDTSKKQFWVMLDEPDNTFHPAWKRRIIQDILDICTSFGQDFQLLISTHSPIMLSDVPKQAAIFLKRVEKNGGAIEKKQQEHPKSNSFGQQIYTLFNDAFFMEQGIIGAFADKKIEDVYKGISDIEGLLSKGEKYQDDKLKEYERIIKLIDEPLLHGHLAQSYKLSTRRIKEM